MKAGSLENLKFDKRLERRKGWVSDEERAASLENLADASHKIAADEDSEGAAAGQSASEADPHAAAERSEPAAVAAFGEIPSSEAVPPIDEV